MGSSNNIVVCAKAVPLFIYKEYNKSMAKIKRKTVYRSSVSGRFVSKADVKRRPSKTEKERVRVKN